MTYVDSMEPPDRDLGEILEEIREVWEPAPTEAAIAAHVAEVTPGEPTTDPETLERLFGAGDR